MKKLIRNLIIITVLLVLASACASAPKILSRKEYAAGKFPDPVDISEKAARNGKKLKVPTYYEYILKIDGCIHDGWLVISQSAEVFDQYYLYWMLSSGYAYSQFCGKVSGAVVKNLNSDKVANSVFPLPPLAEQKRIVARIEELLPLCERLRTSKGKEKL